MLLEQQQHGILPSDPATYGVLNIAFSPDGRLLAAADGDGYVRLWNPVTEQPIGAPLPADPGGGVSGVAFSPDGTLLATADTDGYVRLWDPAARQAAGAPLPADTNGSVSAMAFSPADSG